MVGQIWPMNYYRLMSPELREILQVAENDTVQQKDESTGKEERTADTVLNKYKKRFFPSLLGTFTMKDHKMSHKTSLKFPRIETF